ncbi:MAG: MarR family transcriptional regulator [Nitrospirales bacterium]|nr:MarR family transcriptional regulator [Nitrospira sp.]MDR4502138.1 MarR family transcriptional regulator [Nitrospirales bacterium]
MSITDYKRDPYLSLLRPLVEAYLAFYRVATRHIESMGLTPSQFDVIAELGGTDGLTCAELGDATLITKGTLTGVLDRLEDKGLLVRQAVKGDRRATCIHLTPQGEALYTKTFPAHAEFLKPYFQGALTKEEVKTMKALLNKFRASFEGT